MSETPAFSVTRFALVVTEWGGHDAATSVTLHATPEDAVRAADLDDTEAEALATEFEVDTESARFTLQPVEVGVTLLEAADGLNDPELLS